MGSRREDSRWPKRRTPRLQGYDYSQAGAYAVTVCTHDGEFLFGRVSDGRMELNEAGRVVEAVWDGLPAYYGHVSLDAFVVMPDHMHGVIVLADVPLPADEGWEGDHGRQIDVGAVRGRRAGQGPAPTQEARASRVGSRRDDRQVRDAETGGKRTSGRRAGRGPAPTKEGGNTRHGLSEVVRGFKSMSGRRVNGLRGTPGVAVWQRGFYEHVVRNDEDLNRIREYIAGNPVRWWLKQEGEAG